MISTLRTKAGIRTRLTKDGGEALDGYNSQYVQATIKKTKAPIGEEEILRDAVAIEGDCNLRGTSLESLEDVSIIDGNLILDTGSNLKDLRGIKLVSGHVIIKAKNEEEMINFVSSTGFKPEKILGSIRLIYA